VKRARALRLLAWSFAVQVPWLETDSTLVGLVALLVLLALAAFALRFYLMTAKRPSEAILLPAIGVVVGAIAIVITCVSAVRALQRAMARGLKT
jgi:hypothetical protein